MPGANVVDAVPALTRDAAARCLGAYQAGAYEAAREHYRRFDALWTLALARRDGR